VACETIRTFFTFWFKIQKHDFYVFWVVAHVYSNTGCCCAQRQLLRQLDDGIFYRGVAEAGENGSALIHISSAALELLQLSTEVHFDATFESCSHILLSTFNRFIIVCGFHFTSFVRRHAVQDSAARASLHCSAQWPISKMIRCRHFSKSLPVPEWLGVVRHCPVKQCPLLPVLSTIVQSIRLSCLQWNTKVQKKTRCLITVIRSILMRLNTQYHA